MNHHRWGPYYRKLREDHVEILYSLYKNYKLQHWRSDTPELDENKSKRQYFIERMNWTFKFIDTYRPTLEEVKNYKSNEKQMVHYKISPKGLKILIQLGYDIDDEHVALVTKEVLSEEV